MKQFYSKLGAEGLKMTPVIIGWIKEYVDGARAINSGNGSVPISGDSGINKNNSENYLRSDENTVTISRSELGTLLELSSTLSDKLQVITLKRTDVKGKLNPAKKERTITEEAADVFSRAGHVPAIGNLGAGKPAGGRPSARKKARG